MPCRARNTTISGSVCASPHSTDATVKPAIDIRKTRLRPYCCASQPLKGIMIAVAIMYDVKTQVIWSWVAERLP